MEDRTWSRARVSPFDLAGFDDILCKDMQMGFATMLESKPLHFSEQATLFLGSLGEKAGDGAIVPSEIRPAFAFPDIHHKLRIMCG
jgi:hypothetical protein